MDLIENAGRIDPWLGNTFPCSCGHQHHIPLLKVVIERDALKEIPLYVKQQGWSRLLLVCDNNTAEAAGKQLLKLCGNAQIQADLCILTNNQYGELAADERAIVQLLLNTPPAAQVLVAVGSGTIHDIVRFTAYKTGREFISVPTAPSVDGFASIGAPIVVEGFKQTIPACAPKAIFADLRLLARSPQQMIAAGFGDMLGKYTSLADWHLGSMLLGEFYCELSAEMTRKGLERCVENIEEIASASEQGMRRLMEGLILSGISMLMIGHSRPASGAEHHLSHFWEMKYLQTGKKALLHGAKVGVAAVMMAQLYKQTAAKRMSELLPLVTRRMNDPDFLSGDADKAEIREAFGAIAGKVFEENGNDFIPSSRRTQLELLAKRIPEQWDEVVNICRRVPAPDQLAQWLMQVGGPSTSEELGVEPALVDDSLRYAIYVRNRYTIMRLYLWLQETL